jgi:hypothetical protein
VNRESVVDVTAKLIAYLKGINISEFEASQGLILFVGVFGKLEQVVQVPPLELVT